MSAGLHFGGTAMAPDIHFQSQITGLKYGSQFFNYYMVCTRLTLTTTFRQMVASQLGKIVGRLILHCFAKNNDIRGRSLAEITLKFITS